MEQLIKDIVGYIKPQLRYDGSDTSTIYLLTDCEVPYIQGVIHQLGYVSQEFLVNLCGPNEAFIEAGSKQLMIELWSDNDIIIRLSGAPVFLTINRTAATGYIQVPPHAILNDNVIVEHVKNLIELGDAIKQYYTDGIHSLTWRYHNAND